MFFWQRSAAFHHLRLWHVCFFASHLSTLHAVVSGQNVTTNSSFCPNVTATKNSFCHTICAGNCGRVFGDFTGFDVMQCSCDEHCFLYGDCCMDFVESCNGTIDSYAGPVNAGRCKHTGYPRPAFLSNPTLYNFIGDCHPGWSGGQTSRELCVNETSSLASLVPVTDFTTGKSYLNMYCALCNFVARTELWEASIHCFDAEAENGTTEELLTSIRMGRCQVISKWPGAGTLNDTYQPRECFAEHVLCNSQCENAETRRKCQNDPFSEPLYAFDGDVWRSFKSRWCAACHLGGLPSFSCAAMWSGAPPSVGEFSFSLLADFDSSGCVMVSFANSAPVKNCDGMSVGDEGVVAVACNDTSDVACNNGTKLVSFVAMSFVAPGSTDWLGILSIVCVAASIVGLSLRVALHPVVEIFQGLAGRSQLCLSLSLLCGLVTFLIGPWLKDYEGMCTAVGLAMHWGFLSAFLWMNVIAYDTWLVFRVTSSLVQRSSGQQRWLLLKYCAYAWGVSAMVVLAAYSLDLAGVDSDLRPFYGAGICWIAQEWALVVFFGAPLGLVIVLNFLLYAATARSLKYALGKSASMSKSKDQRRFGVYVRLFLLMGITWVIAYAAIFAESDILWAVYTVLNASQGVFLSVSSLGTKAVLRNLFGKKLKAQSSRTLSSLETRSTSGLN